jgi:hypothetical protein
LSSWLSARSTAGFAGAIACAREQRVLGGHVHVEPLVDVGERQAALRLRRQRDAQRGELRDGLLLAVLVGQHAGEQQRMSSGAGRP